MRRDYFTLSVSNLNPDDPAGAGLPTVEIDFQGPESTLRDRFTDNDDEVLDAEDTDVTFRLQNPAEDAEAEGVVAVTNRLTGDFILEMNADAEDVLEFISAARRYADATGTDARYRVDVSFDGDHFVTYEKSTFLVYNKDGDLLRSNSLIPSGVEL